MNSETHIVGSSADGDNIHVRQYDNEVTWLVEISGHQPKLSRQLLATGAVQRPGYDSLVVDANAEQLIRFLAAANGYRCKLARKQKRQYSPEHRAVLAERLRKSNPTKNVVFMDVSEQESTFQAGLDIDEGVNEDDIGFAVFGDGPDHSEVVGLAAMGL